MWGQCHAATDISSSKSGLGGWRKWTRGHQCRAHETGQEHGPQEKGQDSETSSWQGTARAAQSRRCARREGMKEQGPYGQTTGYAGPMCGSWENGRKWNR